MTTNDQTAYQSLLGKNNNMLNEIVTDEGNPCNNGKKDTINENSAIIPNRKANNYVVYFTGSFSNTSLVHLIRNSNIYRK